MQIYTNQATNTEMNKRTNVQTYKRTNVQTYKYTNVQKNKYTNVQTYKCGRAELNIGSALSIWENGAAEYRHRDTNGLNVKQKNNFIEIEEVLSCWCKYDL